MTTELIANSPTPGSSTPITSLASSVGAPAAGTVETWTVQSAAPVALRGGAGTQFRLTIDQEICIVDASTSSGTSWTVTRGDAGTTPRAHTIGTGIFHYPTAEALKNLPISSSQLPLSVVIDSSASPKGVDSTGVAAGNVLRYDPVSGKFIIGPNFVLAPTGLTTPSFTLTLPNLDGIVGIAGQLVIDGTGTGNTAAATATNGSKLIRLDHYGSGTDSSGDPSYALEILNEASASGAAIVIHEYSNQASSAAAGIFCDVTTNWAHLILRNAQNSGAAPGSHGTGPFLDLRGYFVLGTTSANGVVTSLNTLTDATTPAAFTAEDVGKNIVIGGVATTIATVVSPTQITVPGTPLTNASGVTYSYDKAPQQMLVLSNNLVFTNHSSVLAPVTFTTSGGIAAALAVTQVAGGTSSSYGLIINNAGSATGLHVGNTGAGKAVNVAQSGAAIAVQVVQSGAQEAVYIQMNSGATGFYGLEISGYTHGALIANSQNSGFALRVNKAGSGAGTAMQLVNAGSGVSLDVTNGSTSIFQILASGQIKNSASANEATGAGSAALGANSPASTNTAPYTWMKVTTSDGSQGYVPVWK